MSYIYAQAGDPLSSRERQVLLAAASGLDRAETAEALTIGIESVKWYRRSLLVKLGARNMTHAVALAMQAEAAAMADPSRSWEKYVSEASR